jgi:carboxymethylenebutenolidase
VHEWWGVNDDIRRICGDFAREGFVAMAIDLYDGQSTTSMEEAIQLVDKMKTGEAMEKIEGAVRFLASDERTNGKVGVTGFCLGGAMALGAAINVPGLSAAVPFYGTPREEFAQFGAHKLPILGHYAKTDPFVRAERVIELRDRAAAAGVAFEVHFYEAGHAFMRKGSPEYDETAAKLAWSRTLAFLREHLG